MLHNVEHPILSLFRDQLATLIEILLFFRLTFF